MTFHTSLTFRTVFPFLCSLTRNNSGRNIQTEAAAETGSVWLEVHQVNGRKGTSGAQAFRTGGPMVGNQELGPAERRKKINPPVKQAAS